MQFKLFVFFVQCSQNSDSQLRDCTFCMILMVSQFQVCLLIFPAFFWFHVFAISWTYDFMFLTVSRFMNFWDRPISRSYDFGFHIYTILTCHKLAVSWYHNWSTSLLVWCAARSAIAHHHCRFLPGKPPFVTWEKSGDLVMFKGALVVLSVILTPNWWQNQSILVCDQESVSTDRLIRRFENNLTWVCWTLSPVQSKTTNESNLETGLLMWGYSEWSESEQ